MFLRIAVKIAAKSHKQYIDVRIYAKQVLDDVLDDL